MSLFHAASLRQIALGIALSALSLSAQAAGEFPANSHASFGIHLLAGLPLGDLGREVNDHGGFGMALSMPVFLGGRFVLRPNVEANGYRVSRYDFLAWLSNTDDKEIFRTYQLGTDLLFYQKDGAETGAYLFGGAAAQWSRFDFVLDDRNSTVVDTHAKASGLWLGAGFGYQFDPHASLEMRVSTAPYKTRRGYATSPDAVKDGYIFHIILVTRF